MGQHFLTPMRKQAGPSGLPCAWYLGVILSAPKITLITTHIMATRSLQTSKHLWTVQKTLKQP